MLDSIFTEAAADAVISMPNLLIAIAAAFFMGLTISFIYMKTHKSQTPSQSFAITLVLLPVVITVIILLVGNSVARAFSLAGAFSIIRFRSAPGDPKDITFVLFSMAVGLACGMGYIVYAAIVAIALCAMLLLLEVFKFGKINATTKQLKITIPENLNYEEAFDEILHRYTKFFKLQKVKTADLGSLYELHYDITTQNGASDKEFIDALRCRNGNLNITLVLDAPQNTEF
jgi:uncharacterized membrane protein YhiD involved in acid resistance